MCINKQLVLSAIRLKACVTGSQTILIHVPQAAQFDLKRIKLLQLSANRDFSFSKCTLFKKKNKFTRNKLLIHKIHNELSGVSYKT